MFRILGTLIFVMIKLKKTCVDNNFKTTTCHETARWKMVDKGKYSGIAKTLSGVDRKEQLASYQT